MKELDDLYRKAFGWDCIKMDAVHLALGCYLCPRWPGRPSPAWAAIIGPASCGKSTIISMFDDVPFTVSVDHLTRNALTSCYKDEDDPNNDFSLLHKLSYSRNPEGEKVWTIQELSSFLAVDPITLEKQLADLRAAHVGKHTSHGGMSGTVTREVGSFGLIVGTTEAFELVRAQMNTFGDRFLAIRMATTSGSLSENMADAKTAWCADPAASDKLKSHIKDQTHKIIERGIKSLESLTVSDLPRTPAQEQQLMAWSVIHSVFSTMPISSNILATAPPKPYRIVEQVKSWGNTHAVMCGRKEWTHDEMRIARRIFHDSMARTNYDILRGLYPVGRVSAHDNMDIYRQWSVFGAVENTGGGPVQFGDSRGVRLTKPYHDLISKSLYFERENL